MLVDFWFFFRRPNNSKFLSSARFLKYRIIQLFRQGKLCRDCIPYDIRNTKEKRWILWINVYADTGPRGHLKTNTSSQSPVSMLSLHNARSDQFLEKPADLTRTGKLTAWSQIIWVQTVQRISIILSSARTASQLAVLTTVSSRATGWSTILTTVAILQNSIGGLQAAKWRSQNEIWIAGKVVNKKHRR